MGPPKRENFSGKRVKEKIFFADDIKFCDFSDFSKSTGYAGPNVPLGLPVGSSLVFVPKPNEESEMNRSSKFSKWPVFALSLLLATPFIG